MMSSDNDMYFGPACSCWRRQVSAECHRGCNAVEGVLLLPIVSSAHGTWAIALQCAKCPTLRKVVTHMLVS